MGEPRLGRVVQPPEDRDMLEDILKAVMAYSDKNPPPKMSQLAILKFMVAKRIHFLGAHYWIGWRVYDPNSGRIVDTGAQVCAFCPTGKA